MKKILFLALAALATLQASAQWRIGVNVGGMYNHYVIDKHYFDASTLVACITITSSTSIISMIINIKTAGASASA